MTDFTLFDFFCNKTIVAFEIFTFDTKDNDYSLFSIYFVENFKHFRINLFYFLKIEL